MNKQLKYNKNARIKGFVSSLPSQRGVFVGESGGTPQDKKDYLFTLANQCRSWREPSFSDDVKYLPVQQEVVALPVITPPVLSSLEIITEQPQPPLKDVSELTILPDTMKTSPLVEGLIVVGVALVVLKILS
jgi:hypothetical protein